MHLLASFAQRSLLQRLPDILSPSREEPLAVSLTRAVQHDDPMSGGLDDDHPRAECEVWGAPAAVGNRRR